jgi:hypothetical protein
MIHLRFHRSCSFPLQFGVNSGSQSINKNRDLRRIFGTRLEEDGENYIMRNFIVCTS